MTKKVYRFYSMALEKQEDFLNRMASDGWQLRKSTKIAYEFTPCAPEEYEYKVIFIGEKSSRKNKEYQSFFEEMGYDVFVKNANINYSVGKVRWRPYGKGGGQIATSPGNINRELLIIGKKRDGKAFDIFNENADFVEYYRPIRNMYINLFVLIAVLLGVTTYSNGVNIPLLAIGCMALAALIGLIFKYAKRISSYKQQAQTYE